MARTRCQLLLWQLSACRDVVCVKLYDGHRAVILHAKKGRCSDEMMPLQ